MEKYANAHIAKKEVKSFKDLWFLAAVSWNDGGIWPLGGGSAGFIACDGDMVSL